MAIIRQKYEGQLDGLIKDLRRLGLRVYFNINNALV
ncbi:MAG: phosphate transport system regulatory protein PhoU, partial [Staphylococcus epidermidis]|nr:phosphate transport system regulatory protein PhoU [Staphylococcus epidermidis]